jgi:hypothetical protein
MALNTQYIIDTSSLTQAYRVYYSFDIAPSFWEFVKLQFINGVLMSNDKVYNEIMWGNDDLSNWLKSEVPKNCIIDTKLEAGVIVNYGNCMNWANSHTIFNNKAKAEFADFENADPWVLSCAINKNLTVVSQEVSAPLSQKNIKLPDACLQFNVRHIDTFSFLRETNFKM